jgi:hypothetical protein
MRHDDVTSYRLRLPTRTHAALRLWFDTTGETMNDIAVAAVRAWLDRPPRLPDVHGQSDPGPGPDQRHVAAVREHRSGDGQVRVELRKVLAKHALPTTVELFDCAYAYVRDNY